MPLAIPLLLPLLLFVVTMALGLGGASLALRSRVGLADWAASLECSMAATTGGGLLIAEVAVRVLLGRLLRYFDVGIRPQPFQLTAWFYFLSTLLLGAGFVVAAFYLRPKVLPTRIRALQVVLLLAWLLSCLFTAVAAGA